MKRIIVILLCVFSLQVKGQRPGTWRVHLPFTDGKSIGHTADEVFAGTSSGIFSISLTGEPLQIFNNLNGLSDNDVRVIKYSKDHKGLWIAYENANMDFLQDGNIKNYSTIFKAPVVGKKQINDIYFFQDEVWLSASYGITRQNIQYLAQTETYRNLGPAGASLEINGLVIFNDTIFASSSLGIVQAAINAPNLADYNYWQLSKSAKQASKVVEFNQQLYAGLDTGLYMYSAGVWSQVMDSKYGPVVGLDVDGEYLTVTFEKRILVYHSLQGLIRNENEVGQRGSVYLKSQGLFSASFASGVIWKTENGNTWYVYPDGPYSRFATDLQFKEKTLWVATGGMSSNWDSYYRNDRFSWFDGQSWKSYTQSDPLINDFRDIWKVAIDPGSQNIYMASYGNGMLVFDGNTVTNTFHAGNSTLDTFVSGSFKRLYVGGLVFDENRQLWITNPGSNMPLKRLSPDGKWYEYAIPSLSINDILTDIIIDDVGQKWMAAPRGKGLVIYNDNKTPDFPFDDKFKVLNGEVGNGALTDLNIQCMAKDKEGSVWVGHQNGLQVFYSPSLVFSNQNFDGQRIITTENGKAAYLFNKEPVISIAVDAGNRKWIGTTKGLFLISSDGKNTIHYFNKSNSPLVSDYIQRIAIHPITGEVFIATDKGIVSFQGTATAPSADFNELEIFPNPVSQGFNGDVIIRGLMENSSVRITDIAGNLVFSTVSNGGTAVWNGLTIDGKKPASGVYLVICSTQDGLSTKTGKIAFVRD